MDDDPYKVVELSDDAWTAKFTLARALELADNVEDVSISMKLKNGTFETMASKMEPGTFALLSKNLELRLEEFLIAGDVEM